MTMISISESDLRSLIYAQLELDNLESMGVDNWEGYGETETITDEQVEQELNNYKKKETK